MVEIWARNWYEDRESRVSQAWLEELRKRFRENGTLDLDDLSDIAALTDRQLYRNIQRDSELRISVQNMNKRESRDYLKLYGSLASAQRALLFSESGLDYASLTDEQQKTALKLASNMDPSTIKDSDIAAAGLRIIAAREQFDKRYLYTLRAVTSLGPIPGEHKFSTPLYVPPPKPAPKQQKQPQTGK